MVQGYKNEESIIKGILVTVDYETSDPSAIKVYASGNEFLTLRFANGVADVERAKMDAVAATQARIVKKYKNF